MSSAKKSSRSSSPASPSCAIMRSVSARDHLGVAAHQLVAQRLVAERLLALLGRRVEDHAAAEDRRHERIRRGLVELLVGRAEERLLRLARRRASRRGCRRGGSRRPRRTRRARAGRARSGRGAAPAGGRAAAARPRARRRVSAGPVRRRLELVVARRSMPPVADSVTASPLRPAARSPWSRGTPRSRAAPFSRPTPLWR